MTSTTRTSIIAVAALIVGGIGGYAISARQPVSVTSTDVAMNMPAGREALAKAKEGIFHLDNAAAALGKGNLDKATSELTDAKNRFTELKETAADKTQPILVAQEAVIVHQFTPSQALETFGEVGMASADESDMTLTKGSKTKPLALSDYTISFGDLNIETEFANTHVALAIEAAAKGDKAEMAKEIRAARRAVTFTFTFDGDEAEEN